MKRNERILREAAAAVVFIGWLGWLILPAILAGAITYFVLGFVINLIHTVYF
jgi:hypothetical protein